MIVKSPAEEVVSLFHDLDEALLKVQNKKKLLLYSDEFSEIRRKLDSLRVDFSFLIKLDD